MKKIGLLAVISLLYYSCKEDTKVPEDVLPPNKMEVVLLDMMRADEILSRQAFTDTASKTLMSRTTLYQDVFSTHKLTKEQFQKSLNFYQNRPDLLKIVLDSMLSEAKRIEQRRNDSLTLKVNKKAV